MTFVHFTPKSGNEKTGPIPVTTVDRSTCPDSCSFKGVDADGKLRGCYAEGFPLREHWNNVSEGVKGGTWAQMVGFIQSLPDGQLMRYAQAGDLPGENLTIDYTELDQMVQAAKGKQVFTYTHKPMTVEDLRRAERLRTETEESKRLKATGMDPKLAAEQARALGAKRGAELVVTAADVMTLRANRAAIQKANLEGLTINISRDSLAEVDAFGVGALPLVVVLPKLEKGQEEPKVTYTPAGHRVVTCPAQWRDTTCEECKICAEPNRDIVVGFRTHGIASRAAERQIKAAERAAKPDVPASLLNKKRRPPEPANDLALKTG